MNKTNRILLAIAFVLGATIATNLTGVSLTNNLFAADCGCNECAVATDCGCDACSSPCECQSDPCVCRKPCKKKRCKKSRKQCCPSCRVECDSCTLKLQHYVEERICFKTEQKIVCVPPVRFPWMKCCPPGKSTTRTVNVLKIHKYTCKACGYKWDVDPLPEPCGPEATPAAHPESEPVETYAPQALDPVVAPVENGVLLPPETNTPPQPGFETPAATPAIKTPTTPGLGKVPTPPGPDE